MKAIAFTARDHTALAGNLFEPEGAPTAAVLISAGTGFPQHTYAKFAAYLAAQGAVVLTFDYRGIGGSKPRDLATMDMEYADWGRRDQSAAIQYLADAYPSLPLHHVGHSVGALNFGLCQNHDLVTRHAFVNGGVGCLHTHHRTFVPAALMLWHLIGPWHLRRQGYVAKGRWWKGEDLPAGVFHDWKRWAHRKNYMMADLDAALRPHWYNEVTAPIQSWTFSDDPIATERASHMALDMYPAAKSHLMVRTPQQIGAKKIGHAGGFSGSSIALWSEIWAWLEQGKRPSNNDMGASGRYQELRSKSAQTAAKATIGW